MSINQNKTQEQKITQCYHCGDLCRNEQILYDEKQFCCSGCKTVYELLATHNMCKYYDITQMPGASLASNVKSAFYDFLDEPHIQDAIIFFKEKSIAHIKLKLPHIHCSSCIWLLENLHKLQSGIISSRVLFMEKEITIVYDSEITSLKNIVLLLSKIGYTPDLHTNDIKETSNKNQSRKQVIKIAIAGFCFGNIMMLSFPDYFSGGNFWSENALKQVFNYAALLLSLPVLIYAASEFFISSYHVLKQKHINIDVPITLAIVVAFIMSVYEIIVNDRMGYLDSMSGIVFFMLVGRFFQNKSYTYLSFQKSLSSYLPVSVCTIRNHKEKYIPIHDIHIGEEIIVREHEIVAADSLLVSDDAWFDYSFVTGESNWIHKVKNDTIFAGAILKNATAQLIATKKPNQNYITQLWNSKQEKKFENNKLNTTEKINIYFSSIVLILGILAASYWLFQGSYSTSVVALITVWIVACPCALLLSTTFTYGNILRLLAKNGFYLKNASVAEKLYQISDIVFDKTGTLTYADQPQINYKGTPLTPLEKKLVYSLCYTSVHPLSKALRNYLDEKESFEVYDFESHPGKGLYGYIANKVVKIGSAKWMGIQNKEDTKYSIVYIQIDGIVKGHFLFQQAYRKNILHVLRKLKDKYPLHLVSGDHDAEKQHLSKVIDAQHLKFELLPNEKTAYIKQLQSQNKKVLMIGDGLNDANAFEQSDIGMAVVANENNYLPSCDAIIHADSISKLDDLISFSRKARTILIICFSISLIYNVVGLSYALRGALQPVVAAILMPASTLCIIATGFIMSFIYAKKYKLKT